jgi:hypothetical protein
VGGDVAGADIIRDMILQPAERIGKGGMSCPDFDDDEVLVL